MDRVFLDANVLFSAAYRGDSALARLWALPDARLVTCDLALEEARRNLEGTEALGRLDRLAGSLEVVGTVAGTAAWLPTEHPQPLNDRLILATAVAAGATHFLTGDRRHFGPLYGQTVEGVQVMRPSAYLNR